MYTPVQTATLDSCRQLTLISLLKRNVFINILLKDSGESRVFPFVFDVFRFHYGSTLKS